MNNLRSVAVAAALLLLLSACGGSDDDAALVDALATNWAEEDEFPEGVTIDCVAEGFVSGIGGGEGASNYGITADNIAEADFDTTPLSEEDARSAMSTMFACDGFEAAILGEMGPGVTDEQASCMADNIDDEPLIALMSTTFMGDGGSAIEAEFENLFESGLIEALTTCGVDG